jgi:uncharacterized membrane-anchored protein
MSHFFSLSKAGKWVLALLLISFCALVHAQDAASLKRAWENAVRTAQPGPRVIQLRDQAGLKLPNDHIFIGQPQADNLMVAMGNSKDPSRIGLVVSTKDEDSWMVVIDYDAEGYVRDDDAKNNWKADDMLASLREGTEEQNKERVERGFKEIQISGWIEPPHYDSSKHQLIWSMAAHDKGDPSNSTINYSTYTLGREGYITLKLLTEKGTINSDKVALGVLLNNLQFNDGKRYADFNSSTDKVAAYGLAALVVGAGIGAKKLGILAIIAAFFLKFLKVFIIAGLAAAYGVVKWLFGSKKSAQTSLPENKVSGESEWVKK